MQALILATDEAAKLYPLTEHIPAPLLPVLNRPIMAYALELLVRGGLRDIGIAVYNGAGCIEAHFGMGTGSGARLTYLRQREPLGSAGSLRWAATGLRETFVVLPGDAIIDFDICAALAFHQSHGGIATVIVHAPFTNYTPEPGHPRRAVAAAPGGRVTAMPPPLAAGSATASGTQVFADTGAYIFEPRVFDCIAFRRRMPQQEPPAAQGSRQGLDCHSDLLPELLGLETLYAHIADGYWNPIHTVPAYHQAQVDALASAGGSAVGTRGRVIGAGGSSDGGKVPAVRARSVRYVSVQDRETAPGIIVGRHVSVHPSAHLVAPVYIGAGSQIGRDAELGPDAVIGANTVVDEAATIRNSSVLEGTYVGRLVKVDGRVAHGGLVFDTGSGESVRVVDRFLLGEVSPHLIVRPVARLLSRVADCAGAFLLLLLSLPALALIAFALLLTSLLTPGCGPSDGRQPRPGRVLELRPRVRFRAIREWRRTGEYDGEMVHGVAERETYGVWHFCTRSQDGARVPLGSFLEWMQLDHLPALLSVLKGDLRLIGVKPLDPSEADRLVEEWQRLPYEGRGGFTGLWYVRGLRRQGLLRRDAKSTDLTDLEEIDELVATDAYYMATRSLLEDLHLLLGTPAAWARSWARIRRTPTQAADGRWEHRRHAAGGKGGWTTWRPRRDKGSFPDRRLSPEAKAAKD